MSFAAEDHKLVDAARKAFDTKVSAYECGVTNDVEAIYLWSRRWLEAEIQSANSDTEKAAAFKAHLDRMKPLAEKTRARVQAGAPGGTPDNRDAVEYFVTEAEMWVKKPNAHQADR